MRGVDGEYVLEEEGVQLRHQPDHHEHEDGDRTLQTTWRLDFVIGTKKQNQETLIRRIDDDLVEGTRELLTNVSKDKRPIFVSDSSEGDQAVKVVVWSQQLKSGLNTN